MTTSNFNFPKGGRNYVLVEIENDYQRDFVLGAARAAHALTADVTDLIERDAKAFYAEDRIGISNAIERLA